MREKRLTKRSLIWRSAKELASGFACITAFVLVLINVIGIVRHTAVLSIAACNIFLVATMAFVVFAGLLTGLPKGLWLLRQQEKLFGFRFSDENLDLDHPDGRWFVSTDFYLLAFRRGYISRIGKIRELSGWGMSEMELWDCEGKKHRIRGKYKDLKALKQWLDAERPEAEDDES